MEKYAQKIAKLLAKAEGTDNPIEAETFRNAAERMMVKWGVEDAMVRDALGTNALREEVIKESIEYDGKFAAADVVFANHVCDGLGNLRCVQTDNRMWDKTMTLHIIGHASDVARALMLVTSLQIQCVTAMDYWWKHDGKASAKAHGLSYHEQFKAKRQFIISFGSQVGDRLRENTREAIAETPNSNSTELVLRDRKAIVDDEVSKFFPRLGKARGMAGSSFGRSEGKAAGNRADIGSKRIPQQRSIGN